MLACQLHLNSMSHSQRMWRVVDDVTYVMTPNRDILIDGFRLDQIYTRANARDDDRNGSVRSGDMIYGSATASTESASKVFSKRWAGKSLGLPGGRSRRV
jgi:hypothetical protein